MRVQTGLLVALGHGKYVRSDDIVAIEPIVKGRGPGRRTLVWVRGLAEPLVASRSDESLVREVVSPADQTTRVAELSATLKHTVEAIEAVPPLLLRVLEEETGQDLGLVAEEGRRVLR